MTAPSVSTSLSCPSVHLSLSVGLSISLSLSLSLCVCPSLWSPESRTLERSRTRQDLADQFEGKDPEASAECAHTTEGVS